jgi:ribonuclease BN (tRNA processing enzyme)
MEFRVLGCHGGESPKHQCPAFLVDGRVCLDAGSITNMLSLKEQQKLEAVVVSHAHLDHVRDLAMLADTRTQQGGPPLIVASTPGTIAVLKKHFFNDKLWPDFSKIPGQNATIIFQTLKPEVETELCGYRVKPIPVDHTVEAAAFLIGDETSSVVYSGDTGPTERLWEVIKDEDKVRALVMEVAFPNEQQKLAHVSCHHTPQSLEAELKKLGVKKRDLPVLLFHIKPVFQKDTEKQLAKIKARNNTILNIGDQYIL